VFASQITDGLRPFIFETMQNCLLDNEQYRLHWSYLHKGKKIMSKRILSFIGLMALMVLMTGVLTAAAPVPVTTFTLEEGLPAVMNVGETHTVTVHVDSDQEFIFAQALPSEYFPGRGVVAAQGDHAGQNTKATLEITFTAKGSTADFPATVYSPNGGVAPVSVVVGVRYKGGYVAVQRYDFTVQVP
jgi:hypothetical protein